MIPRQPAIVDIRAKLPRNTAVSPFSRRRLSDIKGVVFHQELGDLDVYGVHRYHTSKECHIAPGKGCPAICYTYFVDRDGVIYQCNDEEAITWSQGGGSAPVVGTKSNTNFLAICFRGDFSGAGHTGKTDPTPAQLASAEALWWWLKDKLSLADGALYGHHHFGKPACPGTVLSALIETLRARPGLIAEYAPKTIMDVQRALVMLGYDLGTFGPNKDGVDGVWGARSNAALMSFQSSHGIPPTGDTNDARTLAAISVDLRALAEHAAKT